MIDLCDEMDAEGVPDANTAYGRAYAYRQQRQYDKAKAAINDALTLHTGDPSVHESYVRERELIETMQSMESALKGLAEEQERSMVSKLEAGLDEAKRVLADSLIKDIEILGIFLAL